MYRAKRYSPEGRGRAVRLLYEQESRSRRAETVVNNVHGIHT